jgi:hypothetical protein
MPHLVDRIFLEVDRLYCVVPHELSNKNPVRLAQVLHERGWVGLCVLTHRFTQEFAALDSNVAIDQDQLANMGVGLERL